ncbi:MAG TPA: sulfatase-like hydrolase/transferase [Allosphingosinicella sp.]
MNRLARLKPWWPLALVYGFTLVLELVLAERKYGLFGGGFGASHVIDRPSETSFFVVALGLAHALLVGLLYCLFRALHRKRPDSPLLPFNFAFFTLAAWVALLTVKYEVLSYFSDAVGFQLLRNLGGGSLLDALLFVMDEAGLLAMAALGAAAAWWILRRLVKRFAPRQARSAPLRWRHLLLLALPLPLALFAAARDPDPRYALSRFTAPYAATAGLEAASDFDRDGYGWFGARIDRHPFDSARHPLALDVPGNGIDEDGYGGDLSFAAPATTAAPRLPASPKHLVLIVLESGRADAIGRRFAGREVTPNLNALARSGSLIPEAYSHVGFTTSSLKSLFSGSLDPAAGGPSLFRDLKSNGYRIGVFSGQPESFGDISKVVGMRKNTDVFVDAETLKAERAFSFAAKGSLLIDGRILLRELDRKFGNPADWAKPTFLYINFQEAHFPYAHPSTMRILPGAPIARGDIRVENKAALERTYWNALAYDDWLIGQVIARLKKLGIWEHTLLAVTADHGESLFDDGFLGHGHMINAQQTRIPFILNAPGIAAAGPVGLDDYRAILLNALGARAALRPEGPVFQHIGPLDSPTAIGMVGKGSVFTVMMMESDQVSFSESGRSARYADLAPGSPERARADALLDRWARERWIAHLARD